MDCMAMHKKLRRSVESWEKLDEQMIKLEIQIDGPVMVTAQYTRQKKTQVEKSRTNFLEK